MSSNECFVWNNFHSIDRHPQHILGWMCYLYDTYDTDVWPQHPASLKKQLRSLSRERVVPNLRIFWHSEIAFFGAAKNTVELFVFQGFSWRSRHHDLNTVPGGCLFGDRREYVFLLDIVSNIKVGNLWCLTKTSRGNCLFKLKKEHGTWKWTPGRGDSY